MQLYLAVTPAQLQEASKYCRSFAHVAYRIGEESALLRQNLLLQTRGGLLSVSDRSAPPISSPEKLCAAVQRECGRRGYTGVLLDFEQPPTRDRAAFAAELAAQLAASRKVLYVPESYHRHAPGAVSLICTALSGGNFQERLQETVQALGGAGHLALDVQRVRMNFLLPARLGEGVPMSEEDLQTLIQQKSPAIFFSQDLCARYFTYSQDGETHFVLFDDAETITKKLRTGSAMGFSAAFLMFPEVRDLLPALFPQRSGRG